MKEQKRDDSMEAGEGIVIRSFGPDDREDVRRIAFETAFLGTAPRVCEGCREEIADFLTLYYTDYEPESCFVAVAADRVVGYVIGSRDCSRMRKVFSRVVVPRVMGRLLVKGHLFRAGPRRFLAGVFRSLLRGEFRDPDFAGEYPATLHINIDDGYRGKHIGTKLISRYLDYARGRGIRGVHFGTLSDSAKVFFSGLGFSLLFSGTRSYLRFTVGADVPYYIFGRAL